MWQSGHQGVAPPARHRVTDTCAVPAGMVHVQHSPLIKKTLIKRYLHLSVDALHVYS